MVRELAEDLHRPQARAIARPQPVRGDRHPHEPPARPRLELDRVHDVPAGRPATRLSPDPGPDGDGLFPYYTDRARPWTRVRNLGWGGGQRAAWAPASWGRWWPCAPRASPRRRRRRARWCRPARSARSVKPRVWRRGRGFIEISHSKSISCPALKLSRPEPGAQGVKWRGGVWSLGVGRLPVEHHPRHLRRTAEVDLSGEGGGVVTPALTLIKPGKPPWIRRRSWLIVEGGSAAPRRANPDPVRPRDRLPLHVRRGLPAVLQPVRVRRGGDPRGRACGAEWRARSNLDSSGDWVSGSDEQGGCTSPCRTGQGSP